MRFDFALTPLPPLSAVKATSSLTYRAERGEVVSRGMGACSAPIPLERIHPLPLPGSFLGSVCHCRGRAGWGLIQTITQTTWQRRGRLRRYA